MCRGFTLQPVVEKVVFPRLVKNIQMHGRARNHEECGVQYGTPQ
jgi:hypothetical protein